MRFISFFILIILSANFLSAQYSREQLDRSVYYRYGEPFYAEAHAFPSNSIDSTEMVVMFRILYDALSFRQVDSYKGKFAAPASVEIEFRDSDEIIQERASWRDTLYLNDYVKTNSKTDYISGYLITKVRTGKYTVNANLIGSRGNKINTKRLSMDFNNKYFSEPAMSEPLFVGNTDKEDIFRPFILGNNISFNSGGADIFLFHSHKKGNKNAHFYELNKVDKKGNNTQWNKDIEMSGVVDFLNGITLEVIQNDKKRTINFKLNENVAYPPRAKSELQFGMLNISIPEDKLVPGNYVLRAYHKGEKDTLKKEFEVIWEDMPLSLKNNVDYAVDLTYYILTEEQFDKINKGSEEEKFRKLLEFWRQKDPTPETPYNEAMAEYYSRVDYAFFNYQTFAERDGAKTDRGKVHILYGPPDEVENELKKDKTIEIWKYDKINKKFIFEAVTSGVYKLKKIEKVDGGKAG